MTAQHQQNNENGNSKRQYKVSHQDLPLACPLPKYRLWDSHPRVYLPIELSPTKHVTCPYCDAEYILVD